MTDSTEFTRTRTRNWCVQLCFVVHLPPPAAHTEELNVPVLSPPLDNELTVGKVYAALMIFDYYKQNRARRLQEQNSSGAPQVCFILYISVQIDQCWIKQEIFIFKCVS